MMPRKQTPVGLPHVYRNKPLEPHVDDSYRTRGKYTEPTVCPECNAVYHAGHWQWLSLPAAPTYALCPACHRIRDGAPAGYVRLEGPFLSGHSSELLAVVRNVEKKEKAERPLNRIMAVDKDEDGVTVTTTDVHLARDIGEAIRHAYQGKLTLHYGPDEKFVRVTWTR
jgi:NMD protein affecting ribosome stability and mRNA decay